MNELPITLVPNPILKQKAKKVTTFGPDLRALAEAMVATMRLHRGIGLAAPQVGQSIRLLVAEFVPEEKGDPNIPLTVLVNPTITDANRETDWLDEGCLSIPGVELPVKRSRQVNVLAQDLDGNRIKIRAKDMFARILQHEIDHINGVLIPERAYPETLKLEGLRVLFLGSPDHANPYLTALAATGVDIVGVVTETDKPVGRSQVLTPSPVNQHATKLSLPVFQFESLKSSEAKAKIASLKPDIGIVVAYGQIIPEPILTLAKYGFLNVHYSLLPAYRGATPHQTAILDGKNETGFTIFKLDTGLDTGPIVVQRKIKIDPRDTGAKLIEKMVPLSVAALLEILPSYIEGGKEPKPQDGSKASYTKLLEKEDGRIDWSQDVEIIDRQIRALWPWPGAFTELYGERLLIHEARLDKDKLALSIVQPAGKKPMTWADFCRGRSADWLTFLEKTGKVKVN